MFVLATRVYTHQRKVSYMPNRENGIVKHIAIDSEYALEGSVAVLDASHKETGEIADFLISGDYRPSIDTKISFVREKTDTHTWATEIEPIGLWRPPTEQKKFLASLGTPAVIR